MNSSNAPAQNARQADNQLISDLQRRVDAAVGKPLRGSYPDASEFIVLRDEAGAEKVFFLEDEDDLMSPKRKVATPRFSDQKSFITYCLLHGISTPIYGQLNPVKFSAILNDHTAGNPGFRDFIATLELAHSEEWNVWTKHNGSGAAFNSTESFAVFLEDNALDMARPAAAEFLQLALNFRVNESVTFSNQQRLQDGHVQLTYERLVDAGQRAGPASGKLDIPELFTIAIPVFKGVKQVVYEVDARFRFRLRESKLTIWYELVRPQKVLEKAFLDIWEEVKAGIGKEILLGTP